MLVMLEVAFYPNTTYLSCTTSPVIGGSRQIDPESFGFYAKKTPPGMTKKQAEKRKAKRAEFLELSNAMTERKLKGAETKRYKKLRRWFEARGRRLTKPIS